VATQTGQTASKTTLPVQSHPDRALRGGFSRKVGSLAAKLLKSHPGVPDRGGLFEEDDPTSTKPTIRIYKPHAITALHYEGDPPVSLFGTAILLVYNGYYLEADARLQATRLPPTQLGLSGRVRRG
jgi:hypothetical protein